MPTIKVNLQNLPKLTNDKFYPLYMDKNRYLVLMGGGGSGKSVFTAQKIILRMLSEQKHRILVLRKVAKTLRESVYAELKKIIYQWGIAQLFKINKAELRIECANGNQILFAGLDDVEKLKSISGVTTIWIEEASEINPEDFRQLDIRLRGQTANYKQMMITFNPIDINHWLKKEFFDVKKDNATVVHSTYKNNKFLDEAAIKVLEAFRETDPYFYQVYCLGEWGVLGKTIFNAQKVNERIAYLRKNNPLLRRGRFVYSKKYVNDEERITDESIKWVDDENGYIDIFEDVKPNYPYVGGGDTAGEGSDNFTGQFINNVTGKQVARLVQAFDEDLYAEQMYCLGKYYNTALLSIETNFSTHPVKVLMRLGYKEMYVREREDTYTGTVQKTYGFRTDKLTRPSAIAELVKVVRDNVDWINDIETLNEMLTFVRNEKGRAEAQEGAKDDLIMGLAITYYSRGQQEERVMQQVVEKKPTPFPFNNGESTQEVFMQW